MKKKIFITLITVLMVLMPQSVFADETEEADLKSKDVTLFANVASSYTVKLPSEVNVENLTTTFDISVKGCISCNEAIQISMPEHVSLVEAKNFTTGHGNINVNISHSMPLIAFDDLEKNVYVDDAKSTVTLTHATIPAGDWSVTLPITIGIVDRTK